VVFALIFAEKSEKFAGKRPVHGCTSRDSGVYYNFLALADRREAWHGFSRRKRFTPRR